MKRTPQQRARRANLAAAASGRHREGLSTRIARVRVVLYDSEPAPQGAQLLAPHRIFAEARDWTIVAELVDTAPDGVPTMTRPLWPRVAELFDSGQVDGIVTSAWTTTDDALLSWLLERHAFAACLGATSGAAAAHFQTPAAADTAPGRGHPDESRPT